MMTPLSARTVAHCTERLSLCSLRPRPASQAGICLQHTESGRRSVQARAAAVESPPAAETSQQARKADDGDDFPDVDPATLTAIPATDKYAVVDIGGSQLFVQEGRWYSVNRLEATPGQKIQLGRVLALKQDGKFNIGTPYLENASVQAEVVEELKGPKLTIFKMRRKKHYRRKTGHRQPLTQFLVTDIKL